MNPTTLQLTDNQQTNLPLLIDDVKRSHGGYRVFAGQKWTFYAASCLSEEQVQRFEWLLDEYGPGKVGN